MNPPLRKRIAHIRAVLAQPLYASLSAIFALLYVGLTMAVVLYIHRSITQFYTQLYASYTVPFTALTVMLSVLFGISMALIVAKVREVRLKSAGFGITGVFFGALAAGCPGCFFGLFPIVLSLFGISATLAILPFNGLELQGAAVAALALSIITLGKETDVSCKLPRRRI